MLFLYLLSLATYLVVCYSAPINCNIPAIVSPLSDLTTSVGSRVSFECRLDVVVAEDEYLNGLVTWSIDGKIEKNNVKEDGSLVIDGIPGGMNNSVIQCSFFSCVSSSAVIILIGQPDAPVLNLVSAALTSVAINISPGNTRGSPVSKIRISLPLRVYSSDIVPSHWSDFTHEITGLSSSSDVLVSVQCWNGYKWSDAGTIIVDTLSPPKVTQENSPTLPTTITTTTITATPGNSASQSRVSLCVLILAILTLI